MGTDVLDLDDAAATFDRDVKVWNLRILHHSPRAIARMVGCSDTEVMASMARMSTAISTDVRAVTAALILDRLDQLQRGFFKDALFSENHRGNPEAAVIWLRGEQMRMNLLGLAAPPRNDAMDALRNNQNTTDELENVIDKLVGKTDRTIDAEAITEGKGDA